MNRKDESLAGHDDNQLQAHPVPPGLVLVDVGNPQILHYVQRAFESVCVSAKDLFGLRLESSCELTSMRALPRRAFETEVRFASTASQNTHLVVLKHVSEAPGFQWLGDEGTAILLQELRTSSQRWVSVELNLDSIPPETPVQLERLRSAAKKSGNYLIAFAARGSNLSTAATMELIAQHADDVAVVNACEPDPDAIVAFSVGWQGLEPLEVLGQRLVMCNVGHKDGRFRYRFRPLIHPQLSTRFMWMLSGQGTTLARIGEMFGVNKSTISRRLAGLPPCQPMKLKLGWENPYIEKLALDCAHLSGPAGSGRALRADKKT